MGRKLDPDKLAEVEAALVDMEPHASIVSRLSKSWPAKRGQVETYVTAALVRMRDAASSMSPEDWRVRLTAMAVDTYRQARKLQHTNGAREMLRFIADLNKVTETEARGIVNIYGSTGAYSSVQGKAITRAVKQLLDGEKPDGDERN